MQKEFDENIKDEQEKNKTIKSDYVHNTLELYRRFYLEIKVGIANRKLAEVYLGDTYENVVIGIASYFRDILEKKWMVFKNRI